MVTSSLHACIPAESSCLLFTNNYAATATLKPFDGSIPVHVTTDSYMTLPPPFIPQLTVNNHIDSASVIATPADAHYTSTTSTRTASPHWIASSVPRGGGGSGNGSSGDGKEENGSRSNASTSIVEEILESPEDYYRVLGLEGRYHCTSTDIQKAYRRRAVQTHPDKTGGDRRAFDLVAKAYEVLSNEETRSVYDKYGMEGLNRGHVHSFQDFFQSMFHPSSSSPSSSAFSRNRTMRYQLQVSLEDLYRGTTHDVWVNVPGKRQGKTVQVHIPRGTVSGQPILMSGAMDFASSKGIPPGDLIFIISPTPHPIFTRKNHDLAMELTISLEEALCGFQRTITHLDGTTIDIASAVVPQDGETPVIIASGDVQVLKGKGFPKGPHGDEYGDLYLQFRVDLPKQKHPSTHPLNHDERQQLRHLLEKLQGKKGTNNNTNNKNEKKTTKRRKGKATEKMPPSDPPSTDSDAHHASRISSVYRLEVGKASDFGRATGIAKIQKDDHGHEHDDDDHDQDDFLGQDGGFSFPFGSGTSTFFHHSNGDGPSRGFHFGNHHRHRHFFSQQGTTQGMEDDDGIPPQCQQM